MCGQKGQKPPRKHGFTKMMLEGLASYISITTVAFAAKYGSVTIQVSQRSMNSAYSQNRQVLLLQHTYLEMESRNAFSLFRIWKC
jgi:hypothetical protein